MKRAILTPGNYLVPRNVYSGVEESLFGVKPSGSDVLPMGLASEKNGFDVSMRERDVWAQSASLLIVAQAIIDSVKASEIARTELNDFRSLSQESSANGSELLSNSRSVRGAEDLTQDSRGPFGQESSGEMGQQGSKPVALPDKDRGELSFEQPGGDSSIGSAIGVTFRPQTLPGQNTETVELLRDLLSNVSVLEAVAQAVSATAREVATILQTIYGNLDFLIGNRDTPLEPILAPLFDSPVGDLLMKGFEFARQYKGPETPDVFVANVISLHGERNTMKIGSDDTYILASFSEKGDPRSPSPDSNDVAGRFELSVADQIVGVNWQNGVYFGQYNEETADSEAFHNFQTGNIDQSGAYFGGERLELVGFLSLAPEAAREEGSAPILGDFLPFNIPVESLGEALNRDAQTIAGNTPENETVENSMVEDEVATEDVNVAPDVQGDSLLGLVEAPLDIAVGLIAPIASIAEVVPVVTNIVPELMAA